MRCLIRKTLAGCVVVAALLASSSAFADGGVVVFSGAITEPTCSVGQQRISAAEASANTAQRYNCTERADASPGQAAQSYALSVTALTETPLASDHLIVYFAHYLSAQPKLVTQTYE
ncbi:hypothetical protein [Dyella subtropica]|uniref:hypothetical protein n=1 Tax=Dyella subtropica TaxID=2992127 RepID=UPI00225349AF|nr:hypothetical protein [Dyella subtropica]